MKRKRIVTEQDLVKRRAQDAPAVFQGALDVQSALLLRDRMYELCAPWVEGFEFELWTFLEEEGSSFPACVRDELEQLRKLAGGFWFWQKGELAFAPTDYFRSRYNAWREKKSLEERQEKKSLEERQEKKTLPGRRQ